MIKTTILARIQAQHKLENLFFNLVEKLVNKVKV